MESAFVRKLRSQVKKGKNVFVAEGARLFGDIHLADNSSVWFNAVLRADYSSIHVGERSNVQDGCIIHVDPGTPCHIGNDCVLGHAALTHGCFVGDNTLVGMRATIMNNARIGKNCIIGAHALITEGKEIPDNSMVLGAPAKVVRSVSKKEIEGIRMNAQRYHELALKYLGK